MKIADIELGEKPLLLAPMEDVTDPSFRYMCKRFGADVVYTEFISSDGLIRDAAKSLKKLEIDAAERPVGIQLYGHLIEPMVEAARMAEAAGLRRIVLVGAFAVLTPGLLFGRGCHRPDGGFQLIVVVRFGDAELLVEVVVIDWQPCFVLQPAYDGHLLLGVFLFGRHECELASGGIDSHRREYVRHLVVQNVEDAALDEECDVDLSLLLHGSEGLRTLVSRLAGGVYCR